MKDQHFPRKRFGQHFLHDRNVIDNIINTINPVCGQTIVEIGPGQGALTLPLLDKINELHVIEIDRDLAQHITAVAKAHGKIHMHCCDVLDFDFHKIPNGHLKIVGNLPYNISTPLIFHLLEQIDCVSEMIFMLQDEVVNRLGAIPGSKEFGRLSVMVQTRCQVKKLFRVGAGAFKPPPKIDSAIVKLIPHENAIVDINSHENFALIVRECFSQRRKTLRNALRNYLDIDAIQSLQIDPGLRPEQLTINQFATLANLYTKLTNQ